QANVREALDIVGRQVPDAGYFDVQRPLYPPATYFLHTAPVLERVGYKRIGRNCSDRLIPVAHFYGSQVYFYHIAVGAKLVHRYPVAYAHHVVRCHLYAGHKTEYGVVENEQ